MFRMDFITLAVFSIALSDIDKSSLYIHQYGKGFVRLQSKSEKLKSADVCSHAQQAIELLQNTQMREEQAALWYEDLAKGINAYCNRLYKHKNIFQKIAWWFGIVSSEERSLYTKYYTCKRRIKAPLGYNLLLNCAAPIDNDVRFAYMSIMDSTKVKIPALDEAGQMNALCWMQERLEHYRESRSINSFNQRKIDRAIAKIKQAKEVAAFSVDNIDALSHKVSAEIRMLRSHDSFTFNGGYQQWHGIGHECGHSVQYRFVAQNNDSVTLTFLNSGEGARKRSDGKVVDDVWENIPSHAITGDFIKLLLFYQMHEVPTNMAEIRKKVSDHLQRYGVRYKTSDTAHKGQRLGNCTIKSLALWMKLELGTSHWHDFKSFYTDYEVEKLERLLSTLPEPEGGWLRREMLRVVLKRRCKKEMIT